MSRCFPYPPPGYTLSGDRNEALIESIKLQKEKQRKKEERTEKKEKRRKRKEKRKERKEKKDKTNQNFDKSDIVKGQVGKKICLDPKDEFFQKRQESESEQFERSSLTEEHGHSDTLPVPSSSYDSTESSNKRKRRSLPIDGSHGYGKAILIRLPSKMQSDLHGLAKGQQLCSISGQTDDPAQHKEDSGLRERPENFCHSSDGTSNIEQGFTPRNNREGICSTSGQIEAPARGKTGIGSMPNAAVNPVQRMELQYKDLLQNWFPPRLEDGSLYPVDSDWLFQDRRNQDMRAEKRQRSGSNSISCSRSSALWPCVEYLHEVDAYALPFVVPY